MIPSLQRRIWQTALRVGAVALLAQAVGSVGALAMIEAGFAAREVTPAHPIWLAGYAARTNASQRVDAPLMIQACALRSEDTRVVLVAVDNCELGSAVTAPAIASLEAAHGLKPGTVIVVSSHSHSTPVVDGPLLAMYPLTEADREGVRNYTGSVRAALKTVVASALDNLQPARLEFGTTRATFAMNRRAFRPDGVVLGENPDGPVDHEVPVLKIASTNGDVRGVLFGYACHATTIAGADFYAVSPDYPGYARQHIETLFPNTTALFLTGVGGDANPSPRGTLRDAKRHGLELAGAVIGRLNRRMHALEGSMRFAYAPLELPLEDAPSRPQLEADATNSNVHVAGRARAYQARLAASESLPASVTLPVSVLRLGGELTLVFMGGEVVVDYGLRVKRVLEGEPVWVVAYAYDVPCYIPSMRVLREGGYEANGSLIYYGLYGPLRPTLEELIVRRIEDLARQTRS